jgi:N-acetylglucosamine malate deacetylase 2
MSILYIFPHPDDESFGPALAIARQRREGEEVHLLTLTRGGATRERHRLGLSVEEMGRVRLDEMREVEGVLDLSSMTVLDFPDSGLKDLDPRDLERAVAEHVRLLRPRVLVTYAVHGISGFPDHLVSHAVVKRAFCEMRDEEPAGAPARLALFTLAESDRPDRKFTLKTSAPEDIDCEVEVGDEEVEIARQALACYRTYREVIRQADPLGRVGTTVYFELFGESHDPRLTSLTRDL